MGEIMTNKEIVSYVKSELNQFETLKKRSHQNNLEVIGKINLIIRANGGTPNPNGITSSLKDFDESWKSPIWDEISKLEADIDSDDLRIKRINEFLKRLQPKDREIITNLHIKNGRDKAKYSDYCFVVNRSRRSLFTYVEQLILRKWK